MSPQDDSARDPIRQLAERWAAESPFIGEAAEEQAPIHPWYQGYTPFAEGRELEEMYGPGFVMEKELRLQRPSSQPLLSSQECQKRLKSTSVAVVGGGFAGLMAARELGQHGIR